MEKYGDLIRQAEYARFKGLTRARICQKSGDKSLDMVWVGGVKLVKLNATELVEYRKWKQQVN